MVYVNSMDGCNETLNTSELDNRKNVPSRIAVGSGFSQGLRFLARMIARDLIVRQFPSSSGDKLTGKQDYPAVRNDQRYLKDRDG